MKQIQQGKELRVLKVARLYCVFTIILIFFIVAPPAMAKENHILAKKQTTIPEQQSVESVIVVGNDVVIKGSVTIAVIVVNGNLKINNKAHIKGPVVVIGGDVEQQKGARVTEQVLSLNLNNETKNSLFLGWSLFLGSWLLKVAGSILLITITVLSGVIFKKRIKSATGYLKVQPGKLVLTGAVAFLGICAFITLLSITIIGIPIVVILLLGVLISFFMGMATISKFLVDRMASMSEKPEWLLLLTAAFVLVSFMNFPLLGGLVSLMIIWLSLGFSVKRTYDFISNLKNRKQLNNNK
ncbi:hypothetical protein B1NLA3E_12225 [Bacillus sp. 1NLA3E]|nr:hypothetical protein B1NLA3E_12225 [Bacillus sp. 1NLA3E]